MKTWKFFPGVYQNADGSGGDTHVTQEMVYSGSDGGDGSGENTVPGGWLNGDGMGKGYAYAPMLREVVP